MDEPGVLLVNFGLDPIAPQAYRILSMRRAMTIAALVVAIVLGYGYWHVSSHGWLYVSLRDVARNDRHSGIKNAEVVFRDSNGNTLARGRTDDRYGVVHVEHPEEGYCTRREQNAPFSSEARQAWQQCFDAQSA